jgi:cytochrome b561
MPIDPLESSHPLSPAPRYRRGAIVFHWTIFGLVVIVGVLGLLHDSWPRQTQGFWIDIHALIGLLLWFILLARFAYRLRHAPPTLPAGIGPLSRRFSSPVHLMLYVLMFIIPIIGFSPYRRCTASAPTGEILWVFRCLDRVARHETGSVGSKISCTPRCRRAITAK